MKALMVLVALFLLPLASSTASICDGQVGAAFGLCTAYYDAMECQEAASSGCEKIADQYNRITGGDIDDLACPCFVTTGSTIYTTSVVSETYPFCPGTATQGIEIITQYTFDNGFNVLVTSDEVCMTYSCITELGFEYDLSTDGYSACVSQYPPNP